MDRRYNVDLPSIRQTVFHVDVSRKYMFDVNQNITIYSLKRMLHAAANLHKVTLRLFHEEIEYTDKDTSTLDDLFPNLQRVDFEIKIAYDNIENFDSLFTKLNFNNLYCTDHLGKYLYYYCYTCNTSICPQCRASGNRHSNHDIKEKFDHLQSSQSIVDKIFANINNEINDNFNRNSSNVKSKDVLKQEIGVKFYDLIEMVKRIEANLKDLIDKIYQEGEKEAIVKLKENSALLKKECIEGLNRLKSEKRIEDILLTEKIFLVFDQCIDTIKDEKGRFIDEVKKYPQYVDQLRIATAEVEKTYEEIYNFLKQYLLIDINSRITRMISAFIVKPIDTTVIKNKINNYIKTITENQSRRGSYYKSDQRERIISYDFSNNDNLDPKKQIEFEPMSSHKMTIVSHEVIGIDSEELKLDNNDLIITQIVEGTSEVVTFTKQTNSIIRKTLPPPSIEVNYNSAWCNYNNKLYISGGIDKNGVESNLFIEYDPSKNKYRRLTNLPEIRSNHSMFIENNNIYFIGGTSINCYKYNLRTFNYEIIGTLNRLRYNPILFKKGNSIYAFFGTDESGHFLSNVEIKQERSIRKWNILDIKGEKNVKLMKCGLIESQPNEIFFLGGITVNGTILSTVMLFDIETNTFSNTELHLREGAYFKESLLIKFEGDLYGNFTLEPNEPFFQVRFG